MASPATPLTAPEGIDPAVYARRGIVLATMCLSLVLIVATVSSVNVAIPSLSKSGLRPTDTQVLWIVDAYALVFAALLLPAGAIGDKFGRKGALLSGLVIFGVASAMCALMKDATALIACRAVMGVGAALIMPSTLSLLQSAFPAAERPKAIAVWSGFAGAGGAIGPLIGGALLAKFWYGSVFFVAAPLAAVAFVASWLYAPSSKEDHASPLDPGGASLSIVGFAALLTAIIEGPERGWSDGLVIAGFAIAVVCLGGFVSYERRSDHPMLNMRFFAKRRFSGGAMGVTFTFLAMFSMFFVLTQYMQYVHGYSPLGAGIRGLPFALVMVAVSPRSPAFAHKYGIRHVVIVGMLFVAVGLLMLSFAGLTTSYWYIALCLVTTSFGVAISTPSLSTGILQSVPRDKAGVGSAVNDTTREVGGAIGIAVIGSIVTSVYRHRAAGALSTLRPDLARIARHNVGAAIEVVRQMPQGDASNALTRTIRESFVGGVHIGLRVSTGLVAIASVVVAARLPHRNAPGGRTAAS